MPRLPLLRRFRVSDTSMQPALRPGDGVIVATWLAPRAGDIIVLHDPERTSSFSVKRVLSLGDDNVEVRGDNVNVSRDSRHFGPVARTAIVGRVVFRYRRRL